MREWPNGAVERIGGGSGIRDSGCSEGARAERRGVFRPPTKQALRRGGGRLFEEEEQDQQGDAEQYEVDEVDGA